MKTEKVHNEYSYHYREIIPIIINARYHTKHCI